MSDSEDAAPRDIRSRIAAFEGGGTASNSNTRPPAAPPQPKKLAPPALPSSAKKPSAAQSASPSLPAGSARPAAGQGSASPPLKGAASSPSVNVLPPRPPLSSKPSSSTNAGGPSPVSPLPSSAGPDELSAALAKRKPPTLPPAATKPFSRAALAKETPAAKEMDAAQASEPAEADSAPKLGSVKAARERLALQYASPSSLPGTRTQPPPPRAVSAGAAKPAIAPSAAVQAPAKPKLPPRLPSREASLPPSESAQQAADPFGDVSQLDTLFAAPAISSSRPIRDQPAERISAPAASADPFGDDSISRSSARPPARARLSPPAQEQRTRSPSQPSLPSRGPSARTEETTFDYDGNAISSSASKPVLPPRGKVGASSQKPAPAFIDFPETVNFGSSSSAASSSSSDKYGYDKPVQRSKTLSGYASSIRDAYSAASSSSNGRPSSKSTSFSDSFSKPPTRSNTISNRSSGLKEFSYDARDSSSEDDDDVRSSRRAGSSRNNSSHNPMFSRPHEIDNSGHGGAGGRNAAAPVSGSTLSTFATRAPLVKSDINGAEAASKTGMDADLWATARYRELFDGMLRAVQEDSTPGHEGRLEADVVRQIWAQSKLSDRVLERIWEECDPYERGSLDKKSFCEGMLLIDEEIKSRKK